MGNKVQQQLNASFKGIEFYTEGESISKSGCKTVIVDYPHSDKRDVEYMGKQPKEFNVTGYIIGDDYRTRWKQLDKALSEKGNGELVLPTFDIWDIHPLGHSLDESKSEIGLIRFTMSYTKNDGTNAPSQSSGGVQGVNQAGYNARGVMAGVFGNSFPNVNTITNMTVGEFDLRSAAQSIASAFSTVNGSAGNLINSAVNSIMNNVPTFLREPLSLAQNLINDSTDTVNSLWDSVASNSDTGEQYANATNLFNYGNDLLKSVEDIRNAQNTQEYTISNGDTIDIDTIAPIWEETTKERIDRNNIRVMLVEATRINALIVAYEQASAKNYSTDVEIDNVLSQLNAGYDAMFNYVKAGAVLSVNRDVVDSVSNVRIKANKVIDEKKQKAFKLTDIEYSGSINSMSLAHKLYAESLDTIDELSEQSRTIAGINMDKSPVVMTGDLKVLEVRA